MKVLKAVIFIVFAFGIWSSVAAVDQAEIDALYVIRDAIPMLAERWPDYAIQEPCTPYGPTSYLTCAGGHISGIDFSTFIAFGNPPLVGTVGNITGLQYVESLTFNNFMAISDLDSWYTQLPSLTTLLFRSWGYMSHTPAVFTANFTGNPFFTTFLYNDGNATVLPWTITGAPNLKSLTLSVPKLASPLPSDMLAGTNLTYLSFYDTRLPVYPDFSHLTYLERLDLSMSLMQTLQDNFTNLVNLRELKLDGSQSLSKLPASLSHCTKLESLSCGYCQLRQADSLPDLSSTRLNRLILYRNGMSIWPTGLCQLPADPPAPGMTLDLSDNPLPNPPACFANTRKLYSIAFRNPAFNAIPSYFVSMSTLTSLIVQCTTPGAGAFPDISGLPSLETLELTNCGLVGNFPSTLPSPLTSMLLSGNNLTGTIPDNVFANTKNLSVLNLASNRLSGPFPSSISAAKLDELIASNNAFSSLPNTIGDLTGITLDFHNNDLSSIPGEAAWANLKMQFVYLHNNRRLTGRLPSFWANGTSYVKVINLSGCSFTGDVPSINSDTLQTIVLSNNALDGIIQPSIKANTVKTFLVDRNGLTGSIPPSLGKTASTATTGMNNPTAMDVSYNRLTGSIPSTFQLYFEGFGGFTYFAFNNNGIEGPLPNLTKAGWLDTFHGGNTKVDLCSFNPGIVRTLDCTLNNVQFPQACGCESWYTKCVTTTITCPAPGYVVPVDPPGTTAPTPILPPGSLPIYTPGNVPPPQGTAVVPTGSAVSISTNVALIFGALLGVLFL